MLYKSLLWSWIPMHGLEISPDDVVEIESLKSVRVGCMVYHEVA